MFNIGGWEFLIILVVALIFLGPERLPGAARQAGKTLGALREMAQSFQNELQDAMNDPIEADARAAGTAAVASDSTASETPDTPDGPGSDHADASGATGVAATAAHIAATEPDRTHKPQSGVVNGMTGDADAAENASANGTSANARLLMRPLLTMAPVAMLRSRIPQSSTSRPLRRATRGPKCPRMSTTLRTRPSAPKPAIPRTPIRPLLTRPQPTSPSRPPRVRRK